MTDVSITIVAYKTNLDVLKRCFDSVQNTEGVSTEVFVVANGEIPGLKGLLHSYPDFELIQNEFNLGFAKASNQGMKKSTGRFILLLNPDTAFKATVLNDMVQHMDEDSEVAIASSIIRFPNGELQPSIRRFPTMIDQLQVLFKIPHFKKTEAIQRYMMEDVDAHTTQDVDSIMGAFMWIRREVTEQIGYMDERFFLWYEEVDYCKRAHDAGMTIRHYADVEIVHERGHDFAKVPTLRKQKWVRQSLRKYASKHFTFVQWILLWALTPLFIVAGLVASVIKRK